MRDNLPPVKGTIALTVLEPGYAQQRWDDEHSRDERRRRIERTLRNAEREMEFILKADTI